MCPLNPRWKHVEVVQVGLGARMVYHPHVSSTVLEAIG